MSTFKLSTIHDNPMGFGPCAVPVAFERSALTPYSKNERLGRAAELNSMGTFQRGARGYNRWREQQHAGHVNAFEKVEVEDETTFSVVDSSSSSGQGRKNHNNNNNGGFFRRPGVDKFGNVEDRNYQGGPQSRVQNWGQKSWATASGKGEQRKKAGKKNFRRFWRDDRPERSRDWSLTIGLDWNLVREITFTELSKLNSSDSSEKPADLYTAGSVKGYNRANDRITAKAPKKLMDYAETSFYRVSASDDPIMKRLAKEGKGNVFTTDAVLTQLMAAGRSLNSWDVVVTKKAGNLWLDKRDGSAFDFLTVSETCNDELPEEDENINSAFSLSREATIIDENFSQQVLDKKSEGVSFGEPIPFAGSDDTAAPKCYKYRKWTFDGGVELIVRCELDGVVNIAGEDRFLSIHAVNEFDPQISRVDWRRKIDNQRGAILANEMKNNSCKMAKWAISAALSGAHSLQIGFVSRLNPKNNKSHQILASQMYKADNFLSSLNVRMSNCWGVVRALIDVAKEIPDGKAIILKDPAKASIRFYTVPEDALNNIE